MEKSDKVRIFSHFSPSHEPLVILYLLFHTSTPQRSVELRMKKESRDPVDSAGPLWNQPQSKKFNLKSNFTCNICEGLTICRAKKVTFLSQLY